MKKQHWIHKYSFLLTICILVVSLLLPGCGGGEGEKAVTTQEEETVTGEEEVVTEEEEVVEEVEEAEQETTTEEEETTLPSDTTPPPAITGLVANNAYDGNVNLWWDKSNAEDFVHYNVYASKTEMADVTGMKAIQEIKDLLTCTYQATGLEDGTKYYFEVTAVDKSGNEDVQVASVSATPAPMPRGTVDPDISVEVYQSELAWAGTTLLADNHNSASCKIIEVNMLGEIVWQYMVPQNLIAASDVELLPNNNILFVAKGGVYEIDRSGKIVWSYLTSKISHDVDRLPNGNTIFVFGGDDQKSDAQVTEVNPKGDIIWTWYAIDHFDNAPYKDIYEDGFTHTNAVSRLANGNTLISLRNFDFVVEVDPKGEVVGTIGEGIFDHQHDPEVLVNGNLLVANHNNLPENKDKPQTALEIDPTTGKIVWQYLITDKKNWSVKDVNRLPNGNTLITGFIEIVEVTPEGKVAWRFKFSPAVLEALSSRNDGFYKADRISAQE